MLGTDFLNITYLPTTAKTLTGTNVTVNSYEVVIEDGKPLVMFFVKDENGHHGIFSQNELTDFAQDRP
jgi:hypothetical protein